MKKLLALLMALVLVFSLAACGGEKEPEETTVPDTTAADVDADVDVEDETTVADETTAAEDETTTEGESTEAPTEVATNPEGETSAVTDETTAPAGDLSKAEFVKLFNAETAKIAKKSTYNFNRNCKYTKAIDVGGATGLLNGIISAIDENSNLDTVVGGFLGIGTKSGSYPKDDLDSDYRIKAATLKESDLGSFTAKNGTYTFTLASAKNPKKTNATPLSRFTNDFITHEEIVQGIADFTTAIKVNSTTINYKNIKVTVTVAEGKITSIKYYYAFDAQLALKAIATINGSGAATTTGTYSNIKY